MTDLKTRVRMAWAVLRGRSVMYRWHATSDGMIPKTLGSISVENTGTTKIAVDLTDQDDSSARPESVGVLDLTSDDAATAGRSGSTGGSQPSAK